MAQEEETQKYSSSNTGGAGFNIGSAGRYSKKQKQKKVPQRGLGVAQLEKIRLEEQQKKDGSVVLPSPPPMSPTRPSNLSVPLPNYQSYSSSIPYPPDRSSPNSILQPRIVDVDSSNTVPLANSMWWQSVPIQVHGNVPKMWNSHQYNLEKESFGVDPGLAFRSSLNFPCESNPISSLPSLVTRSQKHQLPSSSVSSSSSMMNVSSASSSSSLLNFQMEPPSNQNYYGNYASIWPEEEKMVGVKRPYPFSLDDPPCPFNCKFPLTIHSISRSDDQIASVGNRGTFKAKTDNPNFREGPSYSNSRLEPNSNKVIKGNRASSEDFLTLAPPLSNLACLDSKLKRPSSCLAYHNYDTFNFGLLPHQATMEDAILQPGPSVSIQQQPYYSFFPPKVMQIGQPTNTCGSCNGGELGESVDLNLKL
ncbi:hypothetical protein K2173_011925 [Erythroxylum novogranatense]|uniref:Uncharacterized protein n=1 Tax=Erythroxylum novogranatense TaxID=1862640 RepID=A0AAV8TG54_9ROSI|nr:hypothetical protein K2173_011925 [Erythroxylum novogranatense]